MRFLIDRFGRRDFLLPFVLIVGIAVALVCLLSTCFTHPLFRPSFVHLWSTVILILYWWGIFVLPDLRKHLNFVGVGIFLDVLLTLYHEVGLRAVSHALGIEPHPFEGNAGLLRFHIWVSAVLLVFYVFVWISGRALLNKRSLKLRWIPQLFAHQRKSWKRAHRMIGIAVIMLNTMSWASSPYWLIQLIVA